jgi:hypothetical protein
MIGIKTQYQKAYEARSENDLVYRLFFKTISAPFALYRRLRVYQRESWRDLFGKIFLEFFPKS